MNLKTIGLAATAANQGFKYLRDQNGKRERDIYQSLLDNLKDGDLDDLHDKLGVDELEELYGAARAHAGEITRDAHDRLDRRRAAFAAAAPSRKERQEFLEAHAKSAKKKKKGGAGKVIKATLGAAALAGGAWAAWEFFLKDKLAGDDEGVKTYRPAPTRTETDRQGNSTVVYSTREEGIEGGVFPADAHAREAETGRTSHEDTHADNNAPTTLDTLADDQRSETGRHELRDDNK